MPKPFLACRSYQSRPWAIFGLWATVCQPLLGIFYVSPCMDIFKALIENVSYPLEALLIYTPFSGVWKCPLLGTLGVHLYQDDRQKWCLILIYVLNYWWGQSLTFVNHHTFPLHSAWPYLCPFFPLEVFISFDSLYIY